ncbi:MaoC-like protein [Aeromicrobium marinum DSM 15272]|uniref:MaoC-like protein n=1 Tax=Aeromicrobium marinum DSM 15272 TaxID=585531 RepID=E2SET7_9ACTN|nr:MaoC/PaaZ C-terminal domain-containing protein [Aeromicrobium marinum]EFQ82384.1 MaoC-like protein [Aeromicrobium marinum DSM 15272]
MPIDPSVAIGAVVGTREFAWSASDVLLYHLGVGAGSRPGDFTSADALRWTLDSPVSDNGGLQVLPSFAVVAPTFHDTEAPSLELPGCDIDLAQVVHGAQEVHLSGPLPTEGSATLTTRITDVWDKGRAAVIWQEGVATGPFGAELWRVRSSIFVKGEGGWGGDRGTGSAVPVPDRAADATTTYTVTPQQALLYRLCGDRNPLHADPGFAEAAGFPAPILHGLCTYGIVLREVVDLLLDGDAAAVGSFAARFAGVVFPGETLSISAWDEPEGIVVTATVGEDARPALSDCVVTRA